MAGTKQQTADKRRTGGRRRRAQDRFVQVRESLAGDPRTLRLASMTGRTRLEMLGALAVLFAWARNTGSLVEGSDDVFVPYIGSQELAAVVPFEGDPEGVTGGRFVHGLVAVEWVQLVENGVVFRGFARQNRVLRGSASMACGDAVPRPGEVLHGARGLFEDGAARDVGDACAEVRADARTCARDARPERERDRDTDRERPESHSLGEEPRSDARIEGDPIAPMPNGVEPGNARIAAAAIAACSEAFERDLACDERREAYGFAAEVLHASDCGDNAESARASGATALGLDVSEPGELEAAIGAAAIRRAVADKGVASFRRASGLLRYAAQMVSTAFRTGDPSGLLPRTHAGGAGVGRATGRDVSLRGLIARGTPNAEAFAAEMTGDGGVTP